MSQVCRLTNTLITVHTTQQTKRTAICRFTIIMIPGLAENRPSLLKGDRVVVRVPNEPHDYLGYVWSLGLNSVKLSMHNAFRRSDCVDIHFIMNPTPFKLAHRAMKILTASQALNQLLCHDCNNTSHAYAETTYPLDCGPIMPTRYSVAANEEQARAVDGVVKSPRGRHIIFGYH